MIVRNIVPAKGLMELPHRGAYAKWSAKEGLLCFLVLFCSCWPVCPTIVPAFLDLLMAWKGVVIKLSQI